MYLQQDFDLAFASSEPLVSATDLQGAEEQTYESPSENSRNLMSVHSYIKALPSKGDSDSWSTLGGNTAAGRTLVALCRTSLLDPSSRTMTMTCFLVPTKALSC